MKNIEIFIQDFLSETQKKRIDINLLKKDFINYDDKRNIIDFCISTFKFTPAEFNDLVNAVVEYNNSTWNEVCKLNKQLMYQKPNKLNLQQIFELFLNYIFTFYCKI